ncbi:MAG: phosphoglycerate dehydrogenase [Myxococcales bacterium]|nr:phosphoglycerate dehydrogenase [Myxococcales bacterium]
MATVKVLVSDKLSEEGVQVLREATDVQVDVKTGLSEDELCAIIGEYHGLVIRSATKVTPKVLAAAKNLKVVGRAGIGVDNVDLPTASKHGVVVMNTPLGNTVTTAEHAIALLMSLARYVPRADASMKRGEWEKKAFQGTELWNKTLGLVGLGNIGKIVADRAQGLKMKVIASDPVLRAEEAERLGVELVSFDELLTRADCISVHTPLVPSTKHLFNDAAFAKMKKNALFVCAARGGIVDEDALARALESKKIRGAALDVFEKEPLPADHPLTKLENIVLTPHLGASTDEAQERVGVQVAHQIVAFLKHGTIENGVNVPSLSGDLAQRLTPQLEVARRLGRLLAQLADGAREIRVTAYGELAPLVAPLAQETLAGFLERHSGQPVSPLSAPYEAKERDIKIVEISEPSEPLPIIRVVVNDGEGIHTASGRRSRGGGLRLVGLEGYEMDAVLKGHALVIHNEDKPGVIGAIGTILGKHGANVARLQVGLDEDTGKALALWNVDAEVSPSLLAELRALPNVSSVDYVSI